MKCKICSGESEKVFETLVLKKYNVSYYQCNQCKFVQTEKPYWLEEAYNNPINLSDTGIVLRNLRLSKITTSLLILFFDTKEQYIDYAGGFGLFTRIMRDIGFDFYWSDPYTKNELARGYEGIKGKKYYLATSFESFEHFDNPLEEVQKILDVADNIILSTEPIPYPLPKVNDWWYYAPEHGQHIAFHSKESFKVMAAKFNLNYYNLDNIHILSKKKIGFLGAAFLSFKYAKHLLYLMYFMISPFMKSKTFEDMDRFK